MHPRHATPPSLSDETVPATEEVVYPESDGKPMGESDDHRDELKDWGFNVLDDRFAGAPTVYVSGNNFIYYTRGVPTDCVSPDVYVVKGVAKRRRRVYKVWEEKGKVPCFVLEITSSSTRREDLGDKMMKYRDELAVPEYFLFDLTADWIPEKLRGYRLERGVYQPIAPNARGRLRSRTLGLELAEVDGHIRFFVPRSQHPLPTRKERADGEQQRADRAQQRADREQQRAEREQRRAERALREVARLRAELDRVREKRPRGGTASRRGGRPRGS